MAIVFGCANGTCASNMTINATCNNSINVRFEHDMDKFYMFHRPSMANVDKYVTIIWYVLGITGNSLAFAVWIQRRMSNSSGYYLAALALNDLTFLPLQLVFELQQVWDLGVLNRPVLCPLFPIPFMTFQYLSVLLVLGFTVERYISICYPFQRDKYCSTSRATKVIISLFVFALVVNVIHGYFWVYDKVSGICKIRDEALQYGEKSLWAIWAWVTEITIFGIAPLMILVINVLVILEAKRISKNDGRIMPLQKNSSQRTSATTLMLLAVSFYLIFSTLPVSIINSIYSSFPPGLDCMSDKQVESDQTWQSYLSYHVVRYIIRELCMSHFALNFYIYMLTGKIFRRELKILFYRLLCRGNINRYRESEYEDVRMSLRSRTNGSIVQ